MTGLTTVGHGTLSSSELVALLQEAGIDALVDVRRYPGSRRHPHFSRDEMERWLPEDGIAYRWEERLGGRRTPRPDSPHVALRNEQFRAYADHMDSPTFRAALDTVLDEATRRSVAVLCAESVWWRCHRRLVADAAALLHDVEVRHLFHDGRLAPHVPTDAARVDPADPPALTYDVGENLTLPGQAFGPD